MMVRVGITGGIGSGKSVVSKILANLGYPVYDADKEAADILNTDEDVKSSVKMLLGEKAFLPNGNPDRPFIASVVFNNSEKLNSLNSIIHPQVQNKFSEWCTLNQHKEIVFKEAAIMFESGSDKGMDRIITVTAPESLRIERVKKRDNKNEEQIRKIISRQLPENELVKRSQFVIVNDENELIIPQILHIIDQIKSNTGNGPSI